MGAKLLSRVDLLTIRMISREAAVKTCPKCHKQFSDDANFCPVDAARLTTAMAKIVGTDSLTDRFDVGDRLGGTRTGAVHRATEKTTNAAVMIKLVAPEVLALAGVAQRLERELKQLERVQSAGVAKILGSGKRDDQVWIAIEALQGAHTLADAINARGPIPVDQAARLVEVIGEALIEAAQVGVVHRDLAPKNILFAGNDIKLINFSLPVPTASKVAGVAEFVAPEQQDGKPVDQRSNIYSLGAIYYYLLAGVPPVAGGTTKLTDVPLAVDAVITRALDRSPTKRFLTVRQFVDEVGRIARAGESFDPKATAAMGKANKPKAMIVETLLGLREGGTAPLPRTVPIASAPTVGSGVPVLASVPVAAPISTGTAIGLAGGADPVSQPARSPWAPPAATDDNATQPIDVVFAAPKPPVVAAPVVAAPILPAAPVVPVAPTVATQAAAPQGKKKADEPRKDKGKFRETMWFKKGELDSTAAISAEEERARTGKSVNDKADSLPIDERYKDDGSITRGDKDKYSLRTGGTMMQAAIRPSDGGGTTKGVSEDALIGEMKAGRTWVFVAIGAAVIGVGLVIFMLAS